MFYVEHWLKAPMQKQDGTEEPREKGTPKGGVISPLLANPYLHYTLDKWMRLALQNKETRRKFAKKTGLARQKRGRKYLGRGRKYQPHLFEHWRYDLCSAIE